MDSGYSGTPLPKKLGIKESSRILIIDPPATLNITSTDENTNDVIVLFVKEKSELERQLPDAIARLEINGGLWIAWPKRASKVPTDITEQTLRDLILPTGLVDNKVCAIDETWSGLRFVWRLELRKK